MKRVFVKTWGCQMNVYDSTRMVDVLAPMGYAPTDSAADADLVILNTCHIREKASEKLYSELGRLRAVKEARAEAGHSTMLAVAGCVAQAEGAEIPARAPFVDLVFGTQTYHSLPDMVARAARASAPVVETDFPAEAKFDSLPQDGATRPGRSAFLAVQEGCDKFCSFCVVPYTRGAEYSRPAGQLLDEARRLVEGGAVELTLLGQNVNAWHGEAPEGSAGSWALGRLIRALAELPGLERIRYTTSHPRDMADELIAAHRDVPKLMPYLHLPVQAGSDRILAAMNRKHSADDYRRIVARLRAANPDIALSGDFIVGFPGESDADFEATLSLVREIGYAQAYSFKYSARPGTPAANLKDQLPEDVKDARLQALQALLWQQSEAFNRSKLGTVMPVLFDRRGKRPGQLLGKSPWMQSVYADAPERLLGRVSFVKISAAHTNSLSGEIVTTDAPHNEYQPAVLAG